VETFPDPLLLGKFGSADNRTRDRNSDHYTTEVVLKVIHHFEYFLHDFASFGNGFMHTCSIRRLQRDNHVREVKKKIFVTFLNIYRAKNVWWKRRRAQFVSMYYATLHFNLQYFTPQNIYEGVCIISGTGAAI
jgi:hypothetical protein